MLQHNRTCNFHNEKFGTRGTEQFSLWTTYRVFKACISNKNSSSVQGSPTQKQVFMASFIVTHTIIQKPLLTSHCWWSQWLSLSSALGIKPFGTVSSMQHIFMIDDGTQRTVCPSVAVGRLTLQALERGSQSTPSKQPQQVHLAQPANCDWVILPILVRSLDLAPGIRASFRLSRRYVITTGQPAQSVSRAHYVVMTDAAIVVAPVVNKVFSTASQLLFAVKFTVARLVHWINALCDDSRTCHSAPWCGKK